jgi:hypothetical protein
MAATNNVAATSKTSISETSFKKGDLVTDPITTFDANIPNANADAASSMIYLLVS